MSTQLEVILALTDRVHDAIDSGEWQEAHALDRERRAELEKLVAVVGAEPAIGSALAALQRRNAELLALVEDHKRRVLGEAASANTGHAAAMAYAQAAS